MKRRKTDRSQSEGLCDELHEDDGIDPRLFFRPERTKDNHKAWQLCKQVERALRLALAACHDDVVRDLLIHSVVPAPDTSRLLVTVGPGPQAQPIGLGEIQQRLDRVRPFLRHQAAAAVCRKKAPDLAFDVLPGEGVQP